MCHRSDNAVDISLWSVVEPGIGITAVCLAGLRPLFRSIFNTNSSRTAQLGPHISWPREFPFENARDGKLSRRSFPDALEMQVPGQQGTTMISFDEFEADCPRDLEQGCRGPYATLSWRSVMDYESEHRHSTNDVS